MVKYPALTNCLSHLTGILCLTEVKACIRGRCAHSRASITPNTNKMSDAALEIKVLKLGVTTELKKIAEWL